MQVTETTADGLRREFKIVVPADTIERQVERKLKDVARKVRLPGFRPGKAPLSILRKRFGPSVMGEVLDGVVDESSRQTLSDRGLRSAGQPKVEITRFDDGQDLEFTLAVELLPEIAAPDYAAIDLERLTVAVDDDMVERRLELLAERRKRFEAPAEPRPSQPGDRVVIDYHGSVDGEAKPDLSAHDFAVDLGDNPLPPEFDEQLAGRSPGDRLELALTLPDSYPDKTLQGKPAVFDVEVKQVLAPAPVAVDEALAKELGLEDLAALRATLRSQIEREFSGLSRQRLKRALLDRLAELYPFDPPSGMVESEFNVIWGQLEEHRAQAKARQEAGEQVPDDPDLSKPEDELRGEYGELAARRVRLGLVLAEIGRSNGIEVTPDELNQAMIAEARRYPGQENHILQFLRDNKKIQENLKLPIFEDKVVDFIIEMATVRDRAVSAEELLRDPDEGDGAAAQPAAGGDAATAGPDEPV